MSELRLATCQTAMDFTLDVEYVGPVAELSTGDIITVRRSRRTVRLMHLAGSSFCETLRRKLHWRGATL